VERAAAPQAPPSAGAWSTQVRSLARDAYRFAHQHGAPDVCRQIQGVASRMNGEVTVAVIGEQSRGKSSLINALLGDGDLLPVDYNVTTNAYISVRRLPKDESEPYALVHFLAPDREPLRIPVSEVGAWASEEGNDENEKDVRGVELFHDHPLIAEGIRLLDTPGVGGLIGAHGDIAIEAVAMADAVLMVVDSTKPVSVSEIEFLKRAVEKERPVVFALSKADLATGADEVLSFAREAFAKQAPALAGAPMLPVSAFLALKAAAVVDDDADYARDLEEDSGLLALVTVLRRDVHQRVTADRAAALLDQVTISLAQLAAPDRELVAASEGTVDPVQQLERLRAELDRIAPRQGPDGRRRELAPVIAKRFEAPRKELQQELVLANPNGALRRARDEMMRRVAENWAKRFSKGKRYNRKLPGEVAYEVTGVWSTLMGRLNDAATAIAVAVAGDLRLADVERLPGEPAAGGDEAPAGTQPGDGPEVDTGKRTLRLMRILVSVLSIVGAPLALVYLLQDREDLRKANLPKAKDWTLKFFSDASYELTRELNDRVGEARQKTTEALEPRYRARVRELALRVGALSQYEEGGSVDAAKARLAELAVLESRAGELAREA
jgi:GTPase SAR1 family protein